MPLLPVSTLSPPLNATRRIVVGAALVAIGYIAALVVSPSTELPFGVSIGSAAAARDAATETRRAAPSASTASESQLAFDYFPDHYVNQAREVAEQPPTF